MNNNAIASIGVFIDGGYYAKINDALHEQYSQNIVLEKLFKYIRNKISELSVWAVKRNVQIV